MTLNTSIVCAAASLISSRAFTENILMHWEEPIPRRLRSPPSPRSAAWDGPPAWSTRRWPQCCCLWQARCHSWPATVLFAHTRTLRTCLGAFELPGSGGSGPRMPRPWNRLLKRRHGQTLAATHKESQSVTLVPEQHTIANLCISTYFLMPVLDNYYSAYCSFSVLGVKIIPALHRIDDIVLRDQHD